MKIILRLLIIVIAVILAVVVYNSHYDVSFDNLETKLGEMIDSDLNIVSINNMTDHYGIHFTFEKEMTYYEGHVFLEPGLNKLYRFGDAIFNKKDGRLYFTEFQSKQENILVVYGYTEDIDGITLQSNAYDDLNIEVNQEKYFYRELHTEYTSGAIEKYIFHRNNSEAEYTPLQPNLQVIDNRNFINNGPKEIVLVTSGAIVLAGYILSLMFTRPDNFIERIFYKMTGAYKRTETDGSEDFMRYPD